MMTPTKFNNPFYQKIYDQVFKKNRNCLIVVVGDTGKGKSYVAMKIAHTLDPKFDADTLKERVIADPKQFVDLVVNRKDQLYTGAAVIFDEAGTGLAAREWFSHNNRAIDYILQTFRYQKLIVIFTVPNMNFIDTHARKLFHYYVEALDINVSENVNVVKIFELSYNKMKPDNPYQKYIRFRGKKLKRLKIKKVPARIWHRYEDYALQFKEMIGRKSLEVQDKKNVTESKKKLYNEEEIIKQIINNKEKYIRRLSGRYVISKGNIAATFDVPFNVAERIKYKAENKLSAEI